MAFTVPYTLAKCSSATGIFHTCYCSGPTVGAQTLTFSLLLLCGHWQQPLHQLHHLSGESGLGVLLGNRHGEVEPRFLLHLQQQDRNLCLGVIRFGNHWLNCLYHIGVLASNSFLLFSSAKCLSARVTELSFIKFFLKNLRNKELKIITIEGS